MSIDGQTDILDALGYDDKAARKILRSSYDMTPLPENMWRQNQTPDRSTDYWYTVLACVGCGIPATRQGLNVDHSIQFDNTTGEQVMPGGPGMREEGVCGLMSKVQWAATHALRIDSGYPGYPSAGEWWGRCYLHEHQKRKCRQDCWEAHHRYLFRMADRVWGDRDWRRP